MKELDFQTEEALQEAILEMIGFYQAMMASDIWFELGEDERFRSAASHAEVNEVLSRLEEKKFIHRGKDEKWRLTGKKREF